jgi:hypothetical protein
MKMKLSFFIPLVSSEFCAEKSCPIKMSFEDVREQRIQSLKFQVIKEISRRYDLADLVADYSGPPPEEHEIENDAEDAIDFDNQKCEIEKSGAKTKVIIHSHEKSNAGFIN